MTAVLVLMFSHTYKSLSLSIVRMPRREVYNLSRKTPLLSLETATSLLRPIKTPQSRFFFPLAAFLKQPLASRVTVLPTR